MIYKIGFSIILVVVLIQTFGGTEEIQKNLYDDYEKFVLQEENRTLSRINETRSNVYRKIYSELIIRIPSGISRNNCLEKIVEILAEQYAYSKKNVSNCIYQVFKNLDIKNTQTIEYKKRTVHVTACVENTLNNFNKSMDSLMPNDKECKFK